MGAQAQLAPGRAPSHREGSRARWHPALPPVPPPPPPPLSPQPLAGPRDPLDKEPPLLPGCRPPQGPALRIRCPPQSVGDRGPDLPCLTRPLRRPPSQLSPGWGNGVGMLAAVPPARGMSTQRTGKGSSQTHCPGMALTAGPRVGAGRSANPPAPPCPAPWSGAATRPLKSAGAPSPWKGEEG